MFGKKEILQRLEEVEQENKRLLWLINNPPKYKVGQKVGKSKVISVKCVPLETPSMSIGGILISKRVIFSYNWEYKIE